MRKPAAIYLGSIVVVVSAIYMFADTSAAQPTPIRFVTSEGSWQAKAGFSEVAIAPGTGRTLFLAGVGAQEEGADGDTLFPGDIASQCKRVWSTIRKQLEAQSASLRNITRARTYVTDVRNLRPSSRCRREAFGNKPPYPPHTFLVVSALAEPEMLIEVEVTAVTPQ